VNAADLKRLFPFASQSCLRRNAADDQTVYPGIGPRAELQEHEESQPKRPVHRAKSETVDARVHGQFRVTVTLRVSDNRKRDADGALSTLLDCLVNAARRLGSVDPGDQHPG